MKISELIQEDYATTAGDDWIPLTREEANRRFKQFGFTNHGKEIHWTENGEDWWYEHACHEGLINPTFSFGTVGLNERDPQTLQDFVDQYKHRLPWREQARAGYEIANKTALKEDAIQYQKIKDQLPPPPDAEDTKGKTTYATSMGDRVGKMLGSVTKGAVDAVSAGVDAFKSAFKGNKNSTADSKGPKLDIVKDLQNLILAKDPNALPKYGADGKMGDETRAAMKKLGLAESSSEPVSFRDMVNVVDEHYPKYYAELSGSDISDRQFERAIVNAYKKIMQKQGMAEDDNSDIADSDYISDSDYMRIKGIVDKKYPGYELASVKQDHEGNIGVEIYNSKTHDTKELKTKSTSENKQGVAESSELQRIIDLARH